MTRPLSLPTPLLSPKYAESEEEKSEESLMESESTDDADKGGEWGESGLLREPGECGVYGGEDDGGSSVAETERQAMSLLKVSEFVSSWSWFSILFISSSLRSKGERPIDSQILEKNMGKKVRDVGGLLVSVRVVV
jgi:hypothetical protein